MSTATETATETGAETRSLANLRHFLDLARRGRHRAASSGEQQAYRIAKALLDNCSGLDGSALRGISEFAERCSVWEGQQAARKYLGLDH